MARSAVIPFLADIKSGRSPLAVLYFFLTLLVLAPTRAQSPANEAPPSIPSVPAPAEEAKPSPRQKQPPSAQAAEKNSRKDQDPLLQLIRSLTPDQKNRLMENIKAWQQLAPELKQALRSREKALHKNLSDEIQEALSGTSFTQEQREAFEKRYREERRKLETSLRVEWEARRKAALEEMTERLKKSLEKTEVQ